MNVQAALEFADRLIYEQTGKHLNDLERTVFVGSWEGQTYDEIYPTNPEYVEKYVGYRLWQKLSAALEEKVTKKQFRGALERALSRQVTVPATASAGAIAGAIAPQPTAHRIFISHRNQTPDRDLAYALAEAINAAGHQALLLNHSHAIHSTTDWLQQIEQNLANCNYFLLLLSPHAAVSEMVLEELRRFHELRGDRTKESPLLLGVRMNLPSTFTLNHDLRTYLEQTYCWEWNAAADTPSLIQHLLNCLNGEPPQGIDCSIGSSSLLDHSREVLPDNATHPPTPSPVADPELPQGQVRLDSRFYLERLPLEAQCYRELSQSGTLIRIKAPRQMGKTSLMSRILAHARDLGYRAVPLSFQHADKSVFSSLEALLRWFCAKIARKLHLSTSIDQHWTDTYGSKDNCTAYFEDVLLSAIETPLVLALDEVDRVFQYPKIADDFFGLLRAWYEEAGYGDEDSDLWAKLRLVVVHSTEVYIPLDVNQSPFNVGLPIELSEFSPEQVQDLVQRHGLHWSDAERTALMDIVGGHPYLVRLALYHIAQKTLTLNELLQNAPTEAGIYGDHLRRHLWNLQQHPKLAQAYHRVVALNEPTELESLLAFKLHSMGLVHLRGNQVTPRFQLYQHYFGDRLTTE